MSFTRQPPEAFTQSALVALVMFRAILVTFLQFNAAPNAQHFREISTYRFTFGQLTANCSRDPVCEGRTVWTHSLTEETKDYSERIIVVQNPVCE